tara:strand:- start:159 stop:491 length:333 start_codon:yes stop_codon:yes gene_type:complete
MKSTPSEHSWIKTNTLFLDNNKNEYVNYEVLQDDEVYTSINDEEEEEERYVSDTDSEKNVINDDKSFENDKNKLNDLSNEEINNNYSFIKKKHTKNKNKHELQEEEYVDE